MELLFLDRLSRNELLQIYAALGGPRVFGDHVDTALKRDVDTMLEEKLVLEVHSDA